MNEAIPDKWSFIVQELLRTEKEIQSEEAKACIENCIEIATEFRDFLRKTYSGTVDAWYKYYCKLPITTISKRLAMIRIVAFDADFCIACEQEDVCITCKFAKEFDICRKSEKFHEFSKNLKETWMLNACDLETDCENCYFRPDCMFACLKTTHI